VLALLLILLNPTAPTQSRVVVARERTEWKEWLESAPLSPRRAVSVRPIGPGLSLGPATSDVPLNGVGAIRLEEREGRVMLREGNAERPVPRGRGLALGAWQLLVSGPPGRAAVTVFAARPRPGKEPHWFPWVGTALHRVTLVPSAAPAITRLLAPEGVEVEASEAGTVAIILAGVTRVLRVMRLPGATEDESELEIYFRDGTSGRTTYPAGRFVALIPAPGGGYLLDFNRARNPFCAYNTAYPCPAPWRGNALTAPIRAGEQYAAEKLVPPPS
jgi:hypothetical protein